MLYSISFYLINVLNCNFVSKKKILFKFFERINNIEGPVKVSIGKNVQDNTGRNKKNKFLILFVEEFPCVNKSAKPTAVNKIYVAEVNNDLVY